MPRAALAVAAGAFAALEQKCWTMQASRRMATLMPGTMVDGCAVGCADDEARNT